MRDERAFEEFVEARSLALLRHARLLCGDPDWAVELAELGLAAAYRRWPELDPAGADALARQAILTAQLGRPGRRGPRLPQPAHSVSAAGEAAEVVWRALDGLPVRRRAVLVLRYAEALSDTEIADRLRCRPEAVAAEAAAGLAALGRILRGRGRPEELLPAALADPPWPTAGAVPAPAAAGGARPDAATPGWGPGAVELGELERRPTVAGVLARAGRDRRRRRAVRAGWAALVAAVAAVAVAVPATVGAGRGEPTGPVPPTAPAAAASQLGLLDWPARGSLVGDQQLLRAALASWRAGTPEATWPADAVSVLYAGEVGGAQVVLLQGVDRASRARVAEVAGTADAGGLRLVRTDPLVARIPVIALSDAELAGPGQTAPGSSGAGTDAALAPATTAGPAPTGPAAAGPPGRLRLLGPPADGSELYVREPGQPASGPLRRLDHDGTGLSEPFDSPGETYVVVLDPAAGRPAAAPTSASPAAAQPGSPTGSPSPSAVGPGTVGPGAGSPGAGGPGQPSGAGSAAGGSGVVSPARLTAVPDVVEYGVQTLTAAAPPAPSYGWYTDARLLAELLREPVRVAALGPGRRWVSRAGPGRGHEFSAQGYEVVSGDQRLVSMVVRLDGRVLCTDLVRLGAVSEPPPVRLVVHRCVAPRYAAGVVQLLAGPGMAAVAVTLAAERPGQRRYQKSFRAPPGTPATSGFTAAGFIDGGFPTGAGRALAATAAGRPYGRALLPAYRR
jgi:DNA-directed RNA polymerase specialized sigma24 family protein